VESIRRNNDEIFEFSGHLVDIQGEVLHMCCMFEGINRKHIVLQCEILHLTEEDTVCKNCIFNSIQFNSVLFI